MTQEEQQPKDLVLGVVIRRVPDMVENQILIIQSKSAPYSKVGFPYRPKEGWILPGGKIEDGAFDKPNRNGGTTYYVYCFPTDPMQEPSVQEPAKHADTRYISVSALRRYLPWTEEINAFDIVRQFEEPHGFGAAFLATLNKGSGGRSTP